MKFCTQCHTTAGADGWVCAVAGCGGVLRAEPLLGVVLDRRYAVERVCGAGGMGVLLLARHTTLGTPFAVKVLTIEGVRGDAAVEAARRFRLEAKVVSGLRHPGIVEVNDYGTAADGRPYIVMEFLDGRDVGDELRAGGPFTPARIRVVLEGVCDALSWAHEHHVVHRDIKPSNVFVARIAGEERIKLLDFGVAKIVAAATSADPTMTNIVGTFDYMAPEQIQPWIAGVSPATDVYALGVTLYELAAGETPFRRLTVGDTINNKLLREFAPLSSLRPGEGWEAVDPVVRRAMAPAPGERFRTVAAFLADAVEALGRVGAEGGAPRRPADESALSVAPTTRSCASCGVPMPPGASFCPFCGASSAAGRDRYLGAILDRTYRLEGRLARQGASLAYRASNTRLSQPVEVRLLPTDFRDSRAAIEEVRREAALAHRLRHPGLASVIDAGYDEASGVVFVVAEWLDGPDLASGAARERLATAETVRAALLSVLETLAHLHANGTPYRGLDPANVVLVRSGAEETVRLRDLGAARAADERSRILPCGTWGPPQFAAPEQLGSAAAVDRRSDVHAVGALLYLCLAGRGPYDDRTEEDVLRRMRSGRLVPPRTVAPDRVAPDFERVILRAMAFRPEDRFTDAAEMAAALRGASLR